MGKSPCHGELGLKKGPWTPEEDQKLLNYVQQHGRHGSWRTIPSKAGIQRCGKSCRLRWTNYLRPDIKRGKFTLHEDQTIIQLHAVLGNRWSAIAAQLSNRTDNEIKNYWHTHLKKRLAKMGVDPTTHKPLNVAFNCNQAKDNAKLSHMAQWESARVEAEGRLVHKSKLIMSTPYSRAAAAPLPLPLPLPLPQPPCLDLIKVWAWANPGKDISMAVNDILSASEMGFDDHLSPVGNVVPVVGLGEGISSSTYGIINSAQLSEAGNPHFTGNLMGNPPVQIYNQTSLDSAVPTYDSLKVPSIVEGTAAAFTEDITTTVAADNTSNILLGVDLEENYKDYNCFSCSMIDEATSDHMDSSMF